MNLYDANFFARLNGISSSSAARVFPIVHKLIGFSSVVDVGCGTGTWLTVCNECGVTDVLGIDGAYVEPSMLLIDKNFFLPHDLTKPLNLQKRFDLAISLEVAEHLPESCAGAFIATLCSLSDAVLFSAAVPGQGGTGHLNEQWPDYWDSRFRRYNFRMIDCIRTEIWEDKSVAPWYRQNTFLSLRFPEKYPQLMPYLDRPLLRLLHPELRNLSPSIRQSLGFLKNALTKRASRQLHQFVPR